MIHYTSGCYIYLVILSFQLLVINFSNAQPDQYNKEGLKIWFNQPAKDWNEALPVGNGRLGAMVFGGIVTERLQLNEETVWTGKPENFINPQAKKALPKVRKLLFDGKYAEAQEMAQENLMGNKTIHSTYQTLGDLLIDFNHSAGIEEYSRELDLETAIARVSYKTENVVFNREIFSSAPDQALVVRLTADKPGNQNLNIQVSRPGNKAEIKIHGNEITLQEHVGEGVGVFMVAQFKILHEGGTFKVSDNKVQIENADVVTIFLSAATDYRGIVPESVSQQQLQEASAKVYETIKKDHITDYQRFFKRVDLDLGTTDATYFTTDARITAMQNGNKDPHLLKLFYQFGRYLLISSSRPGSLPANLQGIWADGLNPPWSADYHININIQMNYWPAEVTNLPEMHLPFLNFIDALRPNGRRTAKEMYGVNGTVAHFTTDVWHFTEPYGKTQWAMWPMGMAWCAQHLWEHYLFNEDKAYLQELAYPILKESATFCLNWLVEHPQNSYLVSGPSISPENTFKTPNGEIATMVMGPTMDHMIIRDLLSNTIEASKILNKDANFRNKMEKALHKLAPTRIGSDGRIMEWTEEFEEPEPGHRHISHLFALHPGRQITHQQNPELLEAARKTLKYRLSHGGGHTGWSRAWIINFYARLQDGDNAHENLLALLRKSTLPNLFDNHPPFQIDGNFGATAGITEMLLQSHAGEIQLLPALPKDWQKGFIKGICARGGFEINQSWENGVLKQVNILSKLGNQCVVRYGEKIIKLDTEKGKLYEFDGQLNRL